jgi:hypothetical protein
METDRHEKTMQIFYNCTEEIANVIEKYYPEVYIEDMDRVNILLQEEINESKRKQAKENYLENINGGSK